MYANVYRCTSQAASRLIPPYSSAKGCCSPSPLVFLPRHPLFLSLSLSLAASRCIQQRRYPSAMQVAAKSGASQRRTSAACAGGDLPERSLSTRGGGGGTEGSSSLRREGIPRHEREAGRPRCRSKTPRACFARILLHSAVVLLSRNLPTRDSLSRTILLAQLCAPQMYQIFPGTNML